MSSFLDELKKCTKCGLCNEVCPICKVSDKEVYTPESKVMLLVKIENNETLKQEEIDSIYLSTRCGACDDACPEDVDITGIIQYERSQLAKKGMEPEKTTHISNNIITKFNPKGLEVPDRASLWVTDDLKLSEDSKIAYMTGCWVSLKNVSIAQDTVRILNFCGIKPKLLPEERCCGLFVIDNGHLDDIKLYAREYTEYIESQGVEKLLVSCPACYNVMKNMYPKLYRKPKYEVISTVEIFKQLFDDGNIKFNKTNGVVSMRDACPLKDIFDVPRDLLKAMGYEIEEPFDKKVFCCGAPAGVKPNFPDIANAIGMLSFKNIENADRIVSYCPFCLHHLDSIKAEKEIDFPVMDISNLIWANMVK